MNRLLSQRAILPFLYIEILVIRFGKFFVISYKNSLGFSSYFSVLSIHTIKNILYRKSDCANQTKYQTKKSLFMTRKCKAASSIMKNSNKLTNCVRSFPSISTGIGCGCNFEEVDGNQ